MGSTPTGRVISVKNLHFHWKFNIGNYEKSFHVLRWLFLYCDGIKKENKYIANYERIVTVSIADSWN